MALYTKIKGDASYVEMGSPTILDGVISGFSTSNYLKLPTFAPGNKSWELKLKFLSNNAGTTQAIVRLNTGTGDYGGMLIGMNANNRLWWNIGSSGTSWFQTNPTIDPVLTNNTWYEILVKYDGSKYTLSIINNGVATVAYTSNTATPIYQQGDTTIGARVTGTTNYFRGSVDLNNTYIKIENTVWFGTSFSKVKVRNGSDSYTIVGSPVINQGTMTNLSPSDYITTKLSYTNIGSFEINIKCKLPSDFESKMPIVVSYGNKLILGLNSGRRIYALFNNGAQGITGTTTLSLSGIYYLRYTLDENKVAKAYVSTDGKTYSLEGSITLNDTNYNAVYTNSSKLQIGTWSYGHSYSSVDTIYLNQSNIIINNKMIWNGIHQDITSWKIHQDNFSKYYTIVDGKLMWANPNIYLQSDGSSYIDSGIIFKGQSTSVKTKYQIVTQNDIVFSSRIDYSHRTFTLLSLTNKTNRLDYNSGELKSKTNTTIGFLETCIENENYKIYFNKGLSTEISATTTAVNFTTPYSVKLFGRSQGSTEVIDTNNGTPIIYYFKFYNNGTLVRHFVPVPKGLLIGNFVVPSNGMFDIVEQKFYENKGTGEFTIGGIPEDYIIEGGKLIWSNPDIYLQSSGTQYIDTGLVRTGLTDSYKYITSLNYQDNQLRQINGSQGFCYFGCVNGYYQVTQASEGHLNLQCPLNEFVDMNILFNCPNQSCTYTIGNTTGSISSCGYSTETKNIYLFNISNLSFYNKCKMKAVQLYKNNGLVRYFISVPKGMLIGDKIAPSNCMFDMVTQTFFENQGTGNFIIGGLSGDYINVGDNIVWVDENVYLKCNGSQYFDSGFKANQDTKIEVDYTVNGSGTQALYCSRNNTNTSTFTMFRPYVSSSTRFDYNTSQNGISGTVSSGTRYNIVVDKNKCYIDNELKYTATYANFQSDMGMIFGCSGYGGGNLGNWSYHKYHKIQLYDNSKLIRYFLPINTNTIIGNFTVPAPGMWDAVTKKFYPNKGTGAFTYGKDS